MPPLSGAISTLSSAQFRRLLKNLSDAERRAALHARGETDLPIFAHHYLPDFTRLPFARFHHQLFAWHHAMGAEPLELRRGLRFALAAPRGSAKSTMVSLLLLLHDIAYRRERFILLISATERQARLRLRALRLELERGAIAAYAPLESATAREILANGVRVEAYGAGSEMRGIAQRAWRPTKIILDDAESSAAASSPRRRTQLHEWFAEVVEHLGDRFTHLLAIGTVLHPQGLLPPLLARPDFTALRLASIEAFPHTTSEWESWRALLTDLSHSDRRERARAFFLQHRGIMEGGSRVLWPEKEDVEELLAQLTFQGRRAFY